MIKCPNPDCGYENVDGTQFCEGCGEELPQGSAAAAPNAVGGNTPIHGAATTPPDMVKCPACENLNPADNVVCEVCGTELHPHAASTSAPTSTQGAASIPAGGTSTPPASMTASLIANTDPSVTTSAVAPTALANTSSVSTDLSLPIVAAGDTTSGFSPLSSTLPAGDAARTSVSTSADTTPMSSTPLSSASDSSDAAPTSSTQSSSDLQPGHVKLTVEQGMTIGKQFVLGDNEVLVGREDDEEQIYPDIDLSDQDEGYVHRKHAQLKFENGTLTVTHLGGANKTRVNNKPLADDTPQVVNIGDKVSFGKVVMRVGTV